MLMTVLLRPGLCEIMECPSVTKQPSTISQAINDDIPMEVGRETSLQVVLDSELDLVVACSF